MGWGACEQRGFSGVEKLLISTKSSSQMVHRASQRQSFSSSSLLPTCFSMPCTLTAILPIFFRRDISGEI